MSAALRLTLMYTMICTLSLLSVFMLSYLWLERTLHRQLDEGLINEIGEYRSLLAAQDITVLKDVLEKEAISEGTETIFFRVLDAEGKTLIQTDMSAWQEAPVNAGSLEQALAGTAVLETYEMPSSPYPARIIYGRVSPDSVLQLGESTAGIDEMLRHFRDMLILGTLMLTGSSVFVGWLMARRALSGVIRVTDVARQISNGDWHNRVPVSARMDEIDDLALSFNDMVEHVQVLIRQLKEITDDIAHDLRTPITRMRMATEAISADRTKSPDATALADEITEDCDRLLEIINTMLEISQTEAGVRPIALENLDLAVIVEDVCELFRPAAEDKGIHMVFESAPGLIVSGEGKRLKRATAHIVDNAIKYTEPGGAVTVRCQCAGTMASVSTQDTGIGIPLADMEKIFARFYRVDQSRGTGGNGLGLCLSRAIIRAHGGDIRVDSEEGAGSTFVMQLPLASE
ncbi:MAG: HAMP domain-containing protein [Candidatus Hydrogenedentes bacterium]|nr:HAMP domain-containing protein [Candidatus Hydrogenedentota bacterium]